MNAVAMSNIISLPNDNILDWSKFKAPVEDKIDVTQNSICLGKGRKHFWKRRRCWLREFSSLPKNVFKKPLFLKVVKSRNSMVKSSEGDSKWPNRGSNQQP